MNQLTYDVFTEQEAVCPLCKTVYLLSNIKIGEAAILFRCEKCNDDTIVAKSEIINEVKDLNSEIERLEDKEEELKNELEFAKIKIEELQTQIEADEKQIAELLNKIPA